MSQMQQQYQLIVDGLSNSGYAQWGFVIYRGTYNNNVQWETFLTLLKEMFSDNLELAQQYDQLWPSLLWTVIEDEENLNGASKDVIRARFREWVAARSVERDGPGVDAPGLIQKSARFRYCIYVDQTCIDALAARRRPGAQQWELDGEVVIIDGTHGHHDEDFWAGRQPQDEMGEEDKGSADESDDFPNEEYVPIEGNTAQDVGWTYSDVRGLIDQYAEWFSPGTDWEKWDLVYRGHRPSQGPKAGRGEPLVSVDLSAREI